MGIKKIECIQACLLTSVVTSSHIQIPTLLWHNYFWNDLQK